MDESSTVSHRQSLTKKNETDGLSSLEQINPDDQLKSKLANPDHQINPQSNINGNDSSVSFEKPVEDDDGKEESTSVAHAEDFFRWAPGYRRVMLTFATICLFGFMTGVEYAVILPTAFDYVKSLTDVDVYVGLILSSYSISGAIAGVIMGKISDMTGKVKILILISSVFEIGGNILYFATKNINIVILGRLISGVGLGAVPPILADVAHRTTEQDRTKAVSIILGCRQLGLLIGPCFTLLVRTMNFHIGSVHVNPLNGPGFLMACVWLTLHVVCWFCFYDRTPATTAGPSASVDSPKHKYTRSDQTSKQDEHKVSFKIYRDQYLRIEMFILFFVTFIAYFNQTALETIVAAFTEKQFGWNTFHTSILFACAGFEIILVYLSLVFFLSKRFKDRYLLVFGFVSLTVACSIGAFFTWGSHCYGWSGRTSDGVVNKHLFLAFVIFVFLDLLGLPFLAAISVSLFTKLTIKELQGFSQGIQRFIMGMGTIVGPVFAASLLKNLHVMMTTMLLFGLTTLIALIIVLKRLRPLSERTKTDEKKDANNNLNNCSSAEDDGDETAALPLSSNNCYVTLVQQDDEQKEHLCGKSSKRSSLTKRHSNSSATNLDGTTGSIASNGHRYDTSSTNAVCVSDERQHMLEKP